MAIDTTATLPDGAEIANLTELKSRLLDRETDVVRCLVEKMATYATGRLIEMGDREEIDHIVSELDARGNGLRDLVHLIVESDLFQSN